MLLQHTAKTLTSTGGAKPPPKCCINAWVVVLFCNNFVGFLVFFTKIDLKIHNVRPIKLVASMSC